MLYKTPDEFGSFCFLCFLYWEMLQTGWVKAHAAFDREPYDGSIVNMGVRNAEGSVCYIIGVRKEIRSRIGKQPGDSVLVKVRERE